MKISIVGQEHMAQSFSYCMERLGHEIVPVGECEVCWIAIDTPIIDGVGNIKVVFDAAREIKDRLNPDALVLCSSQCPVGTSRGLMDILGGNFAYIPEHMRIGRGISDFTNLKQITVGVDNDKCNHLIKTLFYDKEVFFTTIETAEMVKHSMNAFFAVSASFINEISDLCEKVGANVFDVTEALKNDARIGKDAYLDVSIGLYGGHLDREINYLKDVALKNNVDMSIINAVSQKNKDRRERTIKKLTKI
jgi:UDPglucose 6-dehydrogenase